MIDQAPHLIQIVATGGSHRTVGCLAAQVAAMSNKEIYVGTDVEADGPIPGPNSMLSFGSAAYTGGKELIATFSANLETLPGATADPKTAEWWTQQPEAPAACRKELEMPETAMRRYVLWLKAPSRIRFPIRLLVPDSLRRRKPLRLTDAAGLQRRPTA
jgi:hypothetical protein